MKEPKVQRGIMIERVARAMFPLVPNCRGRSFEDHPMRDDLMKKARAAIEAMREPSEAMVAVGDNKISECIHFYAGGSCHIVEGAAPTAVWQAMIDAALKGEAE